MDFEKLKAFIVVAEELNFRRSAEILGMSQPPLTRLIAGLEKELNVQLFERSTRRVKLTSAGVVLLKEAKEIKSALKRIESDVKTAGKVKNGSLRIGFTTTAYMVGFIDIVNRFKEQFPTIKLELQESNGKKILKGISEEQFDVGVIEGVPQFESLQTHLLNLENVGALLPSKHPLAKRKSLSLKDLKNETFILHHKNEESEFHKLIAKTLNTLKKSPSVYIRREGESCAILVATGKGISLTLEGATLNTPRGTSFVPVTDLFLPTQIFWNKDEISPELNTFLSFIIENKTLAQNQTRCVNLSL